MTLVPIFFFFFCNLTNYFDFSICKNWSINDQKELGGIADIKWWCDDVMYVLMFINI